mgnify:CR=1 FL=1
MEYFSILKFEFKFIETRIGACLTLLTNVIGNFLIKYIKLTLLMYRHVWLSRISITDIEYMYASPNKILLFGNKVNAKKKNKPKNNLLILYVSSIIGTGEQHILFLVSELGRILFNGCTFPYVFVIIWFHKTQRLKLKIIICENNSTADT